MSESPPQDKFINTRTYEIGGSTYVVSASQSKNAREDAVAKIRRLIHRDVQELIKREDQEQE